MVQPFDSASSRRVGAFLVASAAVQYKLETSNHGWRETNPGSQQDSAPRRDSSAAKDVLVVEDETYLCELVADVLEAEGHRTRTAANGLEALQRIRESKPQIVLLDLMMPVMDGWEFLRALRGNTDWQDIPVVIVTAVYDVKRTQQETGAVAVVTKPFDIDQIAEAVTRYSA